MRIRLSAYHMLTLCLCLQLGFWIAMRGVSPDYTIVPPLPSTAETKMLALGDNEFLFRSYGFQLQNAGDTYGRITPLTDYNYQELQHWFLLLDQLNSQSHFSPSLASYIYSQTPNTADIEYIVDYLHQHGTHDIEHKWWWLTQAVYLSQYKLNDTTRALKSAYALTNAPETYNFPIWARQLPAFIHAKLDEKEAALAIITHIAERVDTLSTNEIIFMNHFIQERLGYINQSVEQLKKESNK